MGRNTRFHQRCDRFGRRRPKREPYDRVLIVCEGKKTEPNYFRGLISLYRLNTANIEISRGKYSSPDRVVNLAEKLYKEACDSKNPFDRVYCVFDKNGHTTYEDALSQISGKQPKNVFYAANSAPCFEYWLLLHYVYTTKSYTNAGEVLSELQEHFPGYGKDDEQIFEKFQRKLENAKSNAERSLEDAINSDTDNPLTYVHELVQYLENIKNERS